MEIQYNPDRCLCVYYYYHDLCNLLWVISVQVKLKGHHLTVVSLELTLHDPVHFVRQLEGQEKNKCLSTQNT